MIAAQQKQHMTHAPQDLTEKVLSASSKKGKESPARCAYYWRPWEQSHNYFLFINLCEFSYLNDKRDTFIILEASYTCLSPNRYNPQTFWQPIDRIFRSPIKLYNSTIVIGFARLLKVNHSETLYCPVQSAVPVAGGLPTVNIVSRNGPGLSESCLTILTVYVRILTITLW